MRCVPPFMRAGWRAFVPGSGAAIALVSGSLLTAAPAALAGTAAATRPLAPAVSEGLNGVFCISATNCWAVGWQRSNSVTLNQILHTTGGDWFPVKAPNPVGKANRASNVLFAVRCTSATNCWAVGYAQRANAARKDQILHWNGMKWTAASAPAPGGTSKGGDINQLNDVSCTSAKDCWAVGR